MKKVKYRIIQNDYRNNDTGFPVKRYYIEYLKKYFWGTRSNWIKYSCMICYGVGCYKEDPSFSTLKQAKKYLVGLKTPLIKNTIIK